MQDFEGGKELENACRRGNEEPHSAMQLVSREGFDKLIMQSNSLMVDPAASQAPDMLWVVARCWISW